MHFFIKYLLPQITQCSLPVEYRHLLQITLFWQIHKFRLLFGAGWKKVDGVKVEKAVGQLWMSSFAWVHYNSYNPPTQQTGLQSPPSRDAHRKSQRFWLCFATSLNLQSYNLIFSVQFYQKLKATLLEVFGSKKPLAVWPDLLLAPFRNCVKQTAWVPWPARLADLSTARTAFPLPILQQYISDTCATVTEQISTSMLHIDRICNVLTLSLSVEISNWFSFTKSFVCLTLSIWCNHIRTAATVPLS